MKKTRFLPQLVKKSWKRTCWHFRRPLGFRPYIRNLFLATLVPSLFPATFGHFRQLLATFADFRLVSATSPTFGNFCRLFQLSALFGNFRWHLETFGESCRLSVTFTARVQKPSLGGRFFAQYSKNNLKVNFLLFSLLLSPFNAF